MSSFPTETNDEVRAIAEGLTPAMAHAVLGATHRYYGIWTLDPPQATLSALHRRGLVLPIGWPRVSNFGLFTTAKLTSLGIRVRDQLGELDEFD